MFKFLKLIMVIVMSLTNLPLNALIPSTKTPLDYLFPEVKKVVKKEDKTTTKPEDKVIIETSKEPVILDLEGLEFEHRGATLISVEVLDDYVYYQTSSRENNGMFETIIIDDYELDYPLVATDQEGEMGYIITYIDFYADYDGNVYKKVIKSIEQFPPKNRIYRRGLRENTEYYEDPIDITQPTTEEFIETTVEPLPDTSPITETPITMQIVTMP